MKCLTKSSVITLWVERKSLNGNHSLKVATLWAENREHTDYLSTVQSG